MAATELLIPAPSEKQTLFLNDTHKYVAFGGARGGGKSWAARVKAILLCLRYKGIKVLIVRRSYPELRANHIIPLRRMLPRAVARYNESTKEFSFSNGSTIFLRYCANAKDLENFQGHEYDVIFLEEATQYDEEVFSALDVCLRGVNCYPKRMYLTCNPGGRGHKWVKRLFVDRAYKATEHPEDYSFIQSLVTDNHALMQADPGYVQRLDALPTKRKAAWRYGDWNVFEGQFFEEFTDDPRRYQERVYTHVIAPFKPPASWRRYRSFDWGYSKPFSCGWWAVDHEGRMYRIAELYGCTGEPDVGVKWPVDKVFAEIARIEREHEYLRGCTITGVADSAIFDAGNDSHAVSIADMAARQGIFFEKSSKARIPGWMQIHYRLQFDDEGRPGLYVFEGCKAFIRTIPLLIYDEVRTEDLDTSQEDHVADETRYFCMLNPINPPLAAPKKPKAYNPLDTDERDEYQFFRR